MSVPAGSYDTLAALDAAASANQAPAGSSGQLLTQTSQIGWETQKVQPPTSLYVTINDFLQLKWWAPFAACELDVSGRLLEPDGTIKQIAFVVPVTLGDLAVTFAIHLAEGFLLDVTVTSPTANIVRGGVFVQVALMRGATSAPSIAQVLLQDYVWTQSICQWPGTPVRSSLEGPGWLIPFVLFPLAGQDWNFGPAPGSRAKVAFLTGLLTTSAAVGNRQVTIYITDGGGSILWQLYSGVLQGASTTIRYTVAPGVQLSHPDPSQVNLPLPDPTILEPTWLLRSATAGMLAGDAWGSLRATSENWIEP